MYKSSYDKIITGFIFILINFNIGPVDIVPDFIGYILISLALSNLKEQSIIYKKAISFSNILILTSLGSFYKVNLADFNMIYTKTTIAILIFASINMILNLFLVYYIILAITELLANRGFADISDTLNSNWHGFLGLSSVVLLLQPFIINVNESWLVLMVIIEVILFIFYVVLLVNLSKAGKELSD